MKQEYPIDPITEFSSAPRYCHYCGKLLVLKPKEAPSHLARRKYCNQRCVGKVVAHDQHVKQHVRFEEFTNRLIDHKRGIKSVSKAKRIQEAIERIKARKNEGGSK